MAEDNEARDENGSGDMIGMRDCLGSGNKYETAVHPRGAGVDQKYP